MKKILPFLIAVLLLSNCSSDQKRLEQEMDDILVWIDDSGLEFTASGTGLYYHIEQAGNPDRIPDSSHEVSFKHMGYLLDSTVFSNGWSPSNHYPLVGLVAGFQEGLKIVGEGGRAVVVFPSTLGYGSTARPGIPEYSPLVFRLELVNYY